MAELKRNPSYSQRCRVCKQAVIYSKIYCERLGEYVEDLVYCPYFEPKPMAKMQATT